MRIYFLFLPHDSYCRLDYINCSPILVANLSQNSCLFLVGSSDSILQLFPHWPFPGSWGPRVLTITCSQTQWCLSKYQTITHNDVEEISPATLWVAHKAVLRGHFMAITITRKRQIFKDKGSHTMDLDKLINFTTSIAEPRLRIC